MTRTLASRLPLAIALAFCAVFTGCTSVKVKSVRDPNYSAKMERVFIVIGGGTESQELDTYLSQQLRDAFSQENVETDVAILTPLDLDEKKHLERAKAFKADGILSISVTTGVISPYGGYPTLIYDASLYDPEFKTRRWRASINNSGGTGLMKRRMREMAEGIVARLKADGVL